MLYAFPPGISVTTLTGRYLHPNGSPVSGSLTFRGPRTLTMPGADTIVLGPIDVVLDYNGEFSVELVSTDNANMSPTGWTYSVTERLSDSAGRSYAIFLPLNPPLVDIADLAPSSPNGGVYLPVVGQQGPQGIQGIAGTAGAAGAAGAAGTPTTVNGKSGSSITLTAGDVGADAAGAATAAQSAAATDATAKVAGHVAASDPHGDRASAAAFYTRKDANLTDLVSPAAARTALGLGGAAVLAVGTAAGTVAAGDDSRLTGPRAPSGAAAGDLSAAYPNPTVSRINGVAVSGSAAPGKVLAPTGSSAAAWTHAAHAGPYVFNVLAYGAVGDGQAVVDGAMTSGSAALACATTTPFTSAVVGKPVMVKGAGPAGVTTLSTTAAAFTDSGHITLAAPAATTISNALVMWGTDDTAAFVQAAADATAYGAAHGSAQVFVPPAAGRFYAIAGPLLTAGTTKGNAQIPVPPVSATTGDKCCLTIEGIGNGSGVQHWEQLVPQMGGSTLVSFGVFASGAAQITSVNNGGNACVIGGPSQPGGFGVAPGIYSNMLLTVKNLSILTAYSLNGYTYSALDMSGLANGHVENFGYGTTGVVPSGDFGGPSSFANGLSVGLLMPANGNNDNCVLKNTTCHGGYTYGVLATEHTLIDTMRLLYCWSALCAVGSYYSSVGATHAIKVLQISIEACSNEVYIMGVGSAGIGPFLDIDQLDTESGAPTFADNTSGNGLAAALGTIRLTGLYTAANIVVTHPTGLKIVDGQKAQPVTSVSGAYTALITDEIILANPTAASFAVTLPSAANTALRLIVKKTDTGANTVTVTPQAGQTIDGASTLVISAAHQAKTVVPFGGNWQVIGTA